MERKELTRRNFLRLAAASTIPLIIEGLLPFNLRTSDAASIPVKEILTEEVLGRNREFFDLAAAGERILLPDPNNIDGDPVDLTAAVAEVLINRKTIDEVRIDVLGAGGDVNGDFSAILSVLAGYRVGFLGIPLEEYDEQFNMATQVSIVTPKELDAICGERAAACAGNTITATEASLIKTFFHEIEHTDLTRFKNVEGLDFHVDDLAKGGRVASHYGRYVVFEDQYGSDALDFTVNNEFIAELGHYSTTKSFVGHYLDDDAVGEFEEMYINYFSSLPEFQELFTFAGNALSVADKSVRLELVRAVRDFDMITCGRIIGELTQNDRDAIEIILSDLGDKIGDNVPLQKALEIDEMNITQYGVDITTAKGFKLLAIYSAIARRIFIMASQVENPDSYFFSYPVEIEGERITSESYFREQGRELKVLDSI
ncbi:hypothetical protein GF389_02885, partial [Candidatus Dojkabacteria bacterium]|nr:hypothetical protein [Candidatus Dojkabacteria bacterium]